MSTNELACRQVVELLNDYLDDTLTEDDRRRVVAHLGACDGCTSALEQLRETIRVASGLTEEAVAAPARDRIRDIFRHWQRELPAS